MGVVRLYVFDCGTLHVPDPSRFQLSRDEVAATDLALPCFLVVHPQGTLIWDVGAVPDAAWKPTGTVETIGVVPSDAHERRISLSKSLGAQLAEVGYRPADIDYLVLSHFHYDHTANAGAFSGATWLVRQAERDAMFAPEPPPVSRPDSYASLRTRRTVIIDSDDYDVFGDGTVVIKTAPGHTPGHQMLHLKLARSGNVLLSGDLYHYPEERSLDRVPTFEFDADATRATRRAVEVFLQQTNTQLWIQHDLLGNAKLRKAPEYYD